MKLKALRALDNLECLNVRFREGKPWFIGRTPKTTVYLLERSELWINRIGGFVLGFLSGLALAWLTKGF